MVFSYISPLPPKLPTPLLISPQGGKGLKILIALLFENPFPLGGRSGWGSVINNGNGRGWGLFI